MVTYSDWIWSKEQQRYYAAVYDDEGEIVEYHWQGGYRQYVQRTKPPHEPSASVADPTASMTAAMSGLSMSTAEARYVDGQVSRLAYEFSLQRVLNLFCLLVPRGVLNDSRLATR
jgi:hypothetical protein